MGPVKIMRWVLQCVAIFFGTVAASPTCTTASANLGMGNCTLELPCIPCIDRSKIIVRSVVHGQMSDLFWIGVKRAMMTATTQMKIDFKLQLQMRKSSIEMAQNIRDVVDMDTPDALIASVVGPLVAAAVEYASQTAIIMTINTGFDYFKQIGSLAHFGADEVLGSKRGMEKFESVAADRGLTLTTCLLTNYGPGQAWSVPRVNGFKKECDDRQLTWIGNDNGLVVPEGDRDGQKSVTAVELNSFLGSNSNSQGMALLIIGPDNTDGTLDAFRDAGRPANILVGHFDTQPTHLANGETLFGIDQNAWLQGYLPVVLSTIYVTTGNLLAHDLYPTGPALQTVSPSADEAQNAV